MYTESKLQIVVLMEGDDDSAVIDPDFQHGLDLLKAMKAAKATGNKWAGLADEASRRLEDPILPDQQRSDWLELQQAGEAMAAMHSDGDSSQGQEPTATPTVLPGSLGPKIGPAPDGPAMVTPGSGFSMIEGGGNKPTVVIKRDAPDVPPQEPLPPVPMYSSGTNSGGAPGMVAISGDGTRTVVLPPPDRKPSTGPITRPGDVTSPTPPDLSQTLTRLEGAMGTSPILIRGEYIPTIHDQTGNPLSVAERIATAEAMGIVLPDTPRNRLLPDEQKLVLLEQELERRKKAREVKKETKKQIPTHDESGRALTAEQRVTLAEQMGIALQKQDPVTGRPYPPDMQIAIYEGRFTIRGGGNT